VNQDKSKITKIKARYIIGASILIIIILTSFALLPDSLVALLKPEGIQRWLTAAGKMAPLLFIAVMALTVASPLPTLPLDIAAGALFGPFLGTLYAVFGASCGAMINFFLARYLGRKFIERFLKGHINFCTICSDKLVPHLILISRLVPVISFDMISYGAGLTKVSARSFFLANFLGMIPLTLAYTSLGKYVTIKLWLAIPLGVVMVALFFAIPYWLEKHDPFGVSKLFRHPEADQEKQTGTLSDMLKDIKERR